MHTSQQVEEKGLFIFPASLQHPPSASLMPGPVLGGGGQSSREELSTRLAPPCVTPSLVGETDMGEIGEHGNSSNRDMPRKLWELQGRMPPWG